MHAKHILITQTKQNHSARLIFFATAYGEHRESALPLLNLLDALRVHNVYRFQILKFTYLWHKGLLPKPFSNYFQYASNVHKYNTRYASKQNLYVKKVRTNGKTDNWICCMCYLGQNSLKSQRTKRISILKTTETLFTVRTT